MLRMNGGAETGDTEAEFVVVCYLLIEAQRLVDMKDDMIVHY